MEESFTTSPFQRAIRRRDVAGEVWSGKTYCGRTQDGVAWIEGRVCTCDVKLMNVVGKAFVVEESVVTSKLQSRARAIAHSN